MAIQSWIICMIKKPLLLLRQVVIYSQNASSDAPYSFQRHMFNAALCEKLLWKTLHLHGTVHHHQFRVQATA